MSTLLRPDPTFYPSPRLAMEAPRENYGYVANLSADGAQPDALAVVDLDPRSPSYGREVHRVTLPNKGDELHHFGWNACSSMLSPLGGHPFVERRYLVVPGIRSSRIYIIDTKPHPTQARIVKVIEPEELLHKTGYSRPHTVHCGPEGIYVSCMGAKGKHGDEGPAGIFVMDCESFEILGPWEIDHGDQVLAYDFWWHLAQDVAVTSEWARPAQFEGGLVAEDLLANKYGHRLHFWDLSRRRIRQTIDLGASHQMVLEVRPAHEPTREYGFVGVVVNTENLNGEIWLWHKNDPKDSEYQIKKIIDIGPDAADPDQLPELLKGFSAVPPLITDIDLSLDDKYLYVSCWGTGELRQYDVSDPHDPKLAGTVTIGGIARRAKHPNGREFTGGPQMVEISRDGRRVYFTNSLYSTWDDQFYPDANGMPGVQVMAHAGDGGGLKLDPDFYVTFGDGYRAHQVRLEGGDCSTDSFCYASV